MNIKQINAATQRVLEGVQAAIERKEDKAALNDRDEEQLAALEEFQMAIEDALEELNNVYDG